MGVIWETVVKLLKVTKNKMMQLSLKKKKLHTTCEME